MTEWEKPYVDVCYTCLSKAGASHMFEIHQGNWIFGPCDGCGVERVPLTRVERARLEGWRKQKESEEDGNSRGLSDLPVSDDGGTG